MLSLFAQVFKCFVCFGDIWLNFTYENFGQPKFYKDDAVTLAVCKITLQIERIQNNEYLVINKEKRQRTHSKAIKITVRLWTRSIGTR